MFEGSRLRRARKRLREKYWREAKPLRDAVEIARQQHKPEAESEKLEEAVLIHGRKIREEISLETNHLLSLAYKYYLSVPEFHAEELSGKPAQGSEWRRTRYIEDYTVTNPVGRYLSSKAREELRRAIRVAKKERLETLRLWVTAVVPSLTGLLGVVVALLAIILGRR